MDEKNPTEPELFYKPGLYAITINPSDRHQYFMKVARMQLFRNYIHEQMVGLTNHGIGYDVRIELSEPRNSSKSSSGPRLHVHGVLEFKDDKAIKYFLLYGFYMLSRESHLDMDSIDDLTKWKTYCLKQQKILREKPIQSEEIL